MTSALIGARTVEQLDDSLDALKNASFSDEELRNIDSFATEGNIDLWNVSATIAPIDLPEGGSA